MLSDGKKQGKKIIIIFGEFTSHHVISKNVLVYSLDLSTLPHLQTVSHPFALVVRCFLELGYSVSMKEKISIQLVIHNAYL